MSLESKPRAVTGNKLVNRALRGDAVSHAPAGPLAVHYCARRAGVTLRDYTLQPELLAECVLQYHHRFQPDAVWVSADTWVSAQAMGAPVAFPGGDQPLSGTGEPLVRSGADIDRIPAPDPHTQGRWPLMLDATRRVRRGLGDGGFVVACFDQYPFSLACALMGVQTLMLKLVDDLPMVTALMERCAEYSIAYGRALAEDGADLLSGGDSPAGLISPALYRQVALPFEQRVIAALRTTTQLPVSLHICGNAMPMLADMATSGANVLELDHKMDIAHACRVVGPDVAIWGNLDPVAVLAYGSPADVRRATRSLIRSVGASAHQRFVVSSGCTLAVETPDENLQALFAEARSESV